MRASGPLDAIGRTPLIELRRLGPKGGARILLKWEPANPTGSMKDRMALGMIRAAQRDGSLKRGQRVVEFTGGSTGSSLAFVCANEGYPLSIVTADCFSDEKIRAMRAYGAEVEVLATPDRRTTPDIQDRMRQRVLDIRAKTGAYWTDQMRNQAQTEGYSVMADEILADAPDASDFVMCVGSGGCAMGTSRRLKAKKPGVRVTLVEPAESATISRGTKGPHGVEGIALGSRPPLLEDKLYDNVVAPPEAEGREMARRLAVEEGLLAGTSTGLNLAAALRVARDRHADATIVTVAVDSGLKYLAGDLFIESEGPRMRDARRKRQTTDLSANIDLT